MKIICDGMGTMLDFWKDFGDEKICDELKFGGYFGGEKCVMVLIWGIFESVYKSRDFGKLGGHLTFEIIA